jgi:hypothetical protein
MFGRRYKKQYTVVYEVWKVSRGVFGKNETYMDCFTTHKAARRWITQERERLWYIGGMRLAMGTEYEIRLGRR